MARDADFDREPEVHPTATDSRPHSIARDADVDRELDRAIDATSATWVPCGDPEVPFGQGAPHEARVADTMQVMTNSTGTEVTTTYRHSPTWALVAAAAVAVLAASWALAANGEVTGGEAAVFRAVNDAPAWLYVPLWLVMQLGNVLGALVMGAGALLVTRRWRPPVAVAVAALTSWQLAKLIKTAVGRGRPSAVLTDVVLPGLDEAGLGFVSGHAAVSFSMAAVLAPYVPHRLRWAPLALASLVAIARLYVGVHLPLDVVGGAALGLAVGAVVNVALGTPTAPGDGYDSGLTPHPDHGVPDHDLPR